MGKRNDEPNGEVALALGGGGFLSVAEMAGLTSGLLSVLMKKSTELVASDNALAESGLFSRVTSINSISGGSWFTSRLAYSENFTSTIEEVAKQQVISSAVTGRPRNETIQEVTKTYNKNDLYLKLIKEGEDTPIASKLTAVGNLVTKIESIITRNAKDLPEATQQAFGLIGTLLDKGFLGNLKLLPIQWFDVVTKVLGDIPDGTTFGDPVQEWAVDKKWRIIVSAETPNSTNPDLFFDGSKKNYLKYNLDPAPPSIFIPVTFSTILGNKSQNEPATYEDATGLLSTYEVVYKGRDFPLSSKKEEEWARDKLVGSNKKKFCQEYKKSELAVQKNIAFTHCAKGCAQSSILCTLCTFLCTNHIFVHR